MFSGDGSLLPSIYADVRHIDDVIATEGVYYTQYKNDVNEEDLELYHLVLDPTDPTPTPR